MALVSDSSEEEDLSENESRKRPRGSPTLLTPQRAQKRVPLSEIAVNGARQLEQQLEQPLECNSVPGTQKTYEKWSDEELKALVEFVLFYSTGDTWPGHKQTEFWSNAGTFVSSRSGATTTRTAKACRSVIIRRLIKKYKTPKEAGRAYFGELEFCADPVDSENPPHPGSSSTTERLDPNSEHRSQVTETAPSDASELAGFQHLLNQLPEDVQLDFLSRLFSTVVKSRSQISVPDDFLVLAANGMTHLQRCGRNNVLYQLAKGLGMMREDKSDSRFPTKRMPMGLLEYATDFFASDNLQSVSCPADYRVWQQTMYCHFGQKWSLLHNGPMWSVTYSSQSNELRSGDGRKRSTMEALVNIPAMSQRSIRRDISASAVTVTADIQTAVLDEAVKSHPESWWWLKADGCDVIKGLKESVRMKWSGDVDLNDGSLQNDYDAYKCRLEQIKKIGISESNAINQLKTLLNSLNKDLDFLNSELFKANNAYCEKLATEKHKEKDMISLSWKVKELDELGESGRQICVEAKAITSRLLETESNTEENIPRRLQGLRQKATEFVKGVVRHQRTAATHVLVFMISNEERNKKPYALPVQCLPYKGLSDMKVRELANSIIQEMVKRKMKVAGFTTDGEWNTLRSKGNLRPLSILQVRSNARAKYANMKETKLNGMLSPVIDSDGNVVAKFPNPAVSNELLTEIMAWKNEGSSTNDVITRLRLRTVPSNYPVHNWIDGKDETEVEKLRSILAQLEYTYQINTWHAKGIPFKHHVYVPEVHPITGYEFCEREDEGHIFKRIGQSLRQGGPRNLQLERFEEALHDPEARLTYCALSGVRKQSVEDVDRLFSSSLIAWMEKKSYTPEAEYLRIVHNWRRACDERGVTNDERSKSNKEFLIYLLDDLMPYHRDEGLNDFSLLEVNRSITGIRGFSRETLVALFANIESREWRRAYNTQHNLSPEHPRASTTDDVECFFSVLRDSVGKDFTLQEVYYGWRRATHEFMKRLDPDLPFYYHTSGNQRFYEGCLMPHFDKDPPTKQKQKRLPQYELLGSNSRVTVAVRGSTSVRTKFHNLPIQLPPPPGVGNAIHEHSYSKQI